MGSAHYDRQKDKTIEVDNLKITAYVQNTPSANSLDIKMNGISPSILIHSMYKEIGMWGFESVGIYENPNLIEIKNIDLYSNVGHVSGSIRIPDSTIITYPKNTDTLLLNSDLNITWKGNSEWYGVSIENVSNSYNYISI